MDLKPEERKKLSEMFKRLSEFRLESEEADNHPFDMMLAQLLKERELDLDYIRESLGEDLFAQFQNFISESRAEDYCPWWKALSNEKVKIFDSKDMETIPIVPSDLPSFRSISKNPPAESLWTNLIDLLFVYVYLSNVFMGDLEEMREESISASLELSCILVNPSHNYLGGVPTVLNAIRQNISSSKDYNNPDHFVAACANDLIALLKTPQHAIRALFHFWKIFDELPDKPKSVFLASKKLYYYVLWLNSEMIDQCELVEEIFTSIIMIIGGFHDKLAGIAVTK